MQGGRGGACLQTPSPPPPPQPEGPKSIPWALSAPAEVLGLTEGLGSLVAPSLWPKPPSPSPRPGRRLYLPTAYPPLQALPAACGGLRPKGRRPLTSPWTTGEVRDRAGGRHGRGAEGGRGQTLPRRGRLLFPTEARPRPPGSPRRRRRRRRRLPLAHRAGPSSSSSQLRVPAAVATAGAATAAAAATVDSDSVPGRRATAAAATTSAASGPPPAAEAAPAAGAILLICLLFLLHPVAH